MDKLPLNQEMADRVTGGTDPLDALLDMLGIGAGNDQIIRRIQEYVNLGYSVEKIIHLIKQEFGL